MQVLRRVHPNLRPSRLTWATPVSIAAFAPQRVWGRPLCNGKLCCPLLWRLAPLPPASCTPLHGPWEAGSGHERPPSAYTGLEGTLLGIRGTFPMIIMCTRAVPMSVMYNRRFDSRTIYDDLKD
ncbi:hypothetical protein GY45DRAFT_415917 [Cubamyces sp. BRFM 1775]|nr:hypothetical protein GY45DRAFT_415917 [Cubamyces sp. BRFM 1775]